MSKISIHSQILEVERELTMRRGVYPRQVGAGKMRQAEAELSAPALVRGHIGEATFATAHFAPLADEDLDAFARLLDRAFEEGPQP